MSFQEKFLTPQRQEQINQLKQSSDETVRNRAMVVEKKIAAGDLSTARRFLDLAVTLQQQLSSAPRRG